MFHGPVDGRAYEGAPKRLVLGSPAPNPFRSTASIAFGIPRTSSQAGDNAWPDPDEDKGDALVGIYSVTGRLVRTLRAGNLTPGYYRVTWNGRNSHGEPVAPGVYIIRVSAKGHTASQKIILLR